MREIGNGPAIVGDLESFIHDLHRRGVMLWAEQAGLRYRAPKGVLTPEERQALSSANEEIALLLERYRCDPGSDGAVSRCMRRAPLSFTQLEHWRDRLRYAGRPIRHIAAEFHLRGAVRIELLKESVAVAGRRHDALRTRIVSCERTRVAQEVAEEYCPELEVIPLGSVPEGSRGAEVDMQIRHAILDAKDYAVSPLFKAVLLTISPTESILLLAMDHIVSDLASLNILCEEIFTAYTQLLETGKVDLPRVVIQFPDYVTRLHAEPEEKLARAVRRLEAIGRTRFPRSYPENLANDQKGFGIVSFDINNDLEPELRAWAKRQGTTIVIATLAAYAALVLRWCGVGETVVQFMTDGRSTADLGRTIGFLAFPVYVRAALEPRSTFIDFLEVITEEYCRAIDEADFGYASAAAERPEFTVNTGMNWLPERSALGGDALGSGIAVTRLRSPVELANILLQQVDDYDQEPVVAIWERDNSLGGQLTYVRNRVSESKMMMFATNIVEFLTAMVRTPARRIMDLEMK